jgi:hypothetical protein
VSFLLIQLWESFYFWGAGNQWADTRTLELSGALFASISIGFWYIRAIRQGRNQHRSSSDDEVLIEYGLSLITLIIVPLIVTFIFVPLVFSIPPFIYFYPKTYTIVNSFMFGTSNMAGLMFAFAWWSDEKEKWKKINGD